MKRTYRLEYIEEKIFFINLFITIEQIARTSPKISEFSL